MNDINYKSLYKKFKNSPLLPLLYFLIALIANVIIVLEIHEYVTSTDKKEIPSLLIGLGLVFSSFMISFSMSFFERFGLTNDIQNHISLEVESLKRKVEELIDSRLSYGLTAAKSADNTEIEVIRNLEDGDKILWIDTVMPGFDLLFTDIKEKVENQKVEIKILLMSPDNVAAEHRKELIKDIVGHENFIVDAKSQETKVFGFLENLDLSKCKGNIEIKYCVDPMAMPLFIFERARTKHEEAYTGFYMHKLASDMPYLKWESSSKSPFYVQLYTYFEKIWDSESNHAPRNHNESDS